MTTEQKAKAYDEALEKAKKLQKTCDSQAVVGWCEHIFPELKESEDERIKKEIISFIADRKNWFPKEEAFLTAAYNDKTSYLFDWFDDNDVYIYEPDGNINHCTSDTYPLEKWHEVEHLSTNLSETQIIIEDHYSE